MDPNPQPTDNSAEQPGTDHWPKAVLDAQQTPWRHSFMGLLRQIASADHRSMGAPRMGMAERPHQESFRLGQQASLAFAPRELASVKVTGKQAHLRVFGLGLLGPNGPLPLHMTELVRERTEAKRDNTLANFLDLFHHRYLTHLYRAWSQGQSAAGLDRADDETFTRYVARLAGDEPHEVQHSALSPHARWASSAHRIRSARDPDGLVSTLARYFGVKVRLHEFRLHWIKLDAQDLCQLGHPRASGMLGLGAVAGELIPDRQSSFRLTIGPLDLNGYLRLTPQGYNGSQDLPALVELVRSFIGLEFGWEVELLIHANAAPPARLGEAAQLGWSSWMGQAPEGKDHITGMVLAPEEYMRSPSAAA
ncbi:type VI secretion system baseplate subunit TssG [Limnohabitans sp.]|jgi:type VI secretion system protein ImpH|uniref:type VI secretion system baseplate subunit TssG n=1 Tax=Limnohabitans sp. TaxID=1907725 RepID=UPI0037C037C3